MRIAITELESISPYGQSRYYKEPKKEKERPDDYEKRTWRLRLHTDDSDEVFIPPMAFKNCIAECAKFLGEQIPGKARATYTKHFEAGILVTEPAYLGIKGSEVEGQWLYVPSNGVRGYGKRVEKCFPVIPHWKTKVTWNILDNTITREVFEKHLIEAGKFIGVGFFRPRNNGFFGRFRMNSIRWEDKE